MKTTDIEALIQNDPLLSSLANKNQTVWFNPKATSLERALPDVGLNNQDVEQASLRLSRFAPFIAKAFPETRQSDGIIESELIEIANMKSALEQKFQTPISGQLLLKKDSHLPISGSIKARGGIYEVLAHAEKLAVSEGLLNLDDDYSILLNEKFRNFFSQYKISVGSTGNLGLSIGIISAKLGFSVTVHMSADAREWKKSKLRKHGVNVVEYAHDYGVAVEQGRKEAEKDNSCFFIDDENSKTLFLGYAVAGERVKAQLDTMDIVVDSQHPLIVYLPCGVGGGPGGVAFGMKLAFGDHVHCIFAEPTQSPCMLLGVYTGLHDKISVQDIGLDNKTAADGLAVGRASGFVGRAMQRLIDGYYTLSDQSMLQLLALVNKNENLPLEPSAVAGMLGPVIAEQEPGYLANLTRGKPHQTTHLVWATGGGMVPDEEMSLYLAAAEDTL